MKNWKIGMRLGFGFGLVLLLLVVMMVMSFSRMASLAAEMDEMGNRRAKVISQANHLDLLLMGRLSGLRDLILLKKDSDIQKAVEAQNARRTEFTDTFKDLGTLVHSEESKKTMAEIDKLDQEMRGYTNQVRELALKNADEEATAMLYEKVNPMQQQLSAAVDHFVQVQVDHGKEEYEKAINDYNTTRITMLALTVAAIVFGIVAGWWITGSVVDPIKLAVRLAEAVAAGDLTQRIDTDRNDETGQLLRALKSMNDGLVQIVGNIRQSVETINTASQEIAAGNIDLSQRTEEQAASLEETAASMEELTSTVKQNAENAREANQLAEGSSDIAQKGGGVVGEVVTTMAGINESSKKIVDIIGVIDGIAFQTNILALNAAVEAARAGEQGRGFAVVAGEVRSLAQRSAAAAKEIKQLINDSVEKVTTGTALVDRAGATMSEVVDSINRVTQIMSEITHASTEQSAGIEQVNTAVTQMDEVTQQNAALVEEAAAAASSLQDQAHMLMQAVNRFKLDSLGHAPLAAMAAAPRVTQVATRVAKPAQRPVKKPIRPAGTVKAGHEVTPHQSGDDWEEF